MHGTFREAFEVSAGVNPSEGKWSKLPEGARGYHSLEELLEADRDAVDAVVISMPTSKHHEAACAALEAGKHVLLEKPACTSREDLDDLYGLAEAKGCVLFVSMHGAYAPEVRWVRDNHHRYGAVVRAAAVYTDSYVREDGDLEPGTVSKLGSWFDSGLNALTALHTALPSAIELSQVCKCTDGHECVEDVAASADLRLGEAGNCVPACITTEWRVAEGADGRKGIAVYCERGVLRTCEATRTVTVDGEGTVFDAGDGGEEGILPDRYAGVLRDFRAALVGGPEGERALKDNTEAAQRVHYALLDRERVVCE